MFGYATNETDVLMPAPIQYAHRLVERQAEVRKTGVLPLLRPDAKSQVSLRYVDGKPVSIDAIVLSTSTPRSSAATHLHEAVMDEIIKPILDPTGLDDFRYQDPHQPDRQLRDRRTDGRCGLTGRKIIVDTYGGMRSASRRRGLLRQGSVQGRSLGGLCGALRRQEHRRRRARGPL
jgi:S-adenosylmethionine synthetase